MGGVVRSVGGRMNRGRHRRRQRAQRPGRRRVCARAGLSVRGPRGPAHAGRWRPHPARPRLSRRAPRHLLGRAPAGAGLAVLRRVRPGGARRGTCGRRKSAYANPFAEAAPRRRLPRASTAPATSSTTATSWRRLLEPLVQRADGVVDSLLGDKRSLPADPVAAALLARRVLQQGTVAWNRPPGGRDADALVHRCCRAYDFTAAVPHVGRRGDDAGHPGPYRRLADPRRRKPGHHRRADRGPARARRHPAAPAPKSREPPGGVVLFDTAPTALLGIYGDRLPDALRKPFAPLPFRLRCGEGGLRAVRRRAWSDPRLASAVTFHLGGDRETWPRRTRGRRGPARPAADGAGRAAAPRRSGRVDDARPAAVLDLRPCAVRARRSTRPTPSPRRRELRTRIPRRRRRRPQRARSSR